MWRPLLVSSSLALVLSLSAAHIIPLPGNTSLSLVPLNITSPAPEEPGPLINLNYTPWPSGVYSITLRGPGVSFLDASLNIVYPKAFSSSPMIRMSTLQQFLRDFADNIEREHPVPDFVPRNAKQTEIDIMSYTRMIIEIHEGPFHGRLPTAMALAALSELGKQLDLHGPASIGWAVTVAQARIPWAYGFLTLQRIQGASFNESLSNGERGLQTA